MKLSKALIRKQAQNGRRILLAKDDGDGLQTALQDILTDLMHACDTYKGLNFLDALGSAREHHAIETGAIEEHGNNPPMINGHATETPNPGTGDADARECNIGQLAKEEFEEEGSLEFDDHPTISEGTDNGAYVQAWQWVDFAGTPLDKEAATFDCPNPSCRRENSMKPICFDDEENTTYKCAHCGHRHVVKTP